MRKEEPKNIHEAAIKFREAIEACNKGRRVVVAWSYVDGDDEGGYELFGNYDITESNWPDEIYNRVILGLVRHISNIPYEEIED